MEQRSWTAAELQAAALEAAGVPKNAHPVYGPKSGDLLGYFTTEFEWRVRGYFMRPADSADEGRK